ncbi:Retrovirus-related Pol polyprotein from transposon RE1 [Vitis vinifera]|uniref:Retrovirus-related Pol polyprotein from transposon RE1 n=1 Tax=Vitis vinifera TaxID=29760 RepID=A0A438DSN9_VITVI|nr:Retrovirus-related Pol polyprotein from transposon RE1 [Vitis vinifera]
MPETTEPSFRKWKIEKQHDHVMAYHSMNNDIELFQVESALHDFRQGEQTVTQYYNTLTRYWQHLDLFETHSWKCFDDAATYRKIVEQKRLFKFFLGLNRELDDVRGRIMGIKPCQVSGRLFQSSGGDRQKRDRPWCDYCKKLGHYKETCWKLHGKPLIGNQSHGLEIGKMIDSAELCSGLYLLSCGQFSNQVSQASCVQSQILKSDNAKEYFTSSLSTYLQNHGIIYISSCVDTPQQNGVAERKNRHLLEGESMNEHQVWESLLEGVPSFHSESPNPSQFAPTELSTPMPSLVQPAQHTNVPSPVTIQSPMPIQPIAPQLANENLQVYIRRRKRQELEHGSQSTCGQYIDSNSSLPEENIGEDRAGEVLIPSIDDSTLPIALRKGVRRCTDHPIGNYVKYEGLSPSYRAFATSLDDTQVPNTIQEAFKISEWKKAVQDEIDALEKNGTWTITDLPLGRGPWGANWCLQQLDIKNAFLNGDLEEEVYMEIPPGFEQSMAKNQADHTLFVKKSHAGKMAILIVYVDDIILSGNDMEELQNLKKYLLEEFEVKDLGNLKYFLGMEVARSRKGIVVSQRKYILDLLKETGILGCKPIDTPMDSQKKLVSRKYTSRQGEISVACRALDLSLTLGQILALQKTENRDTEVYSDVDWAGNIIDRRSTSGYCSFFWGNLVTWRSKKQSVVARSSAEVEYRALAQESVKGFG